MGLIERAAKRLAELREAGVEVPQSATERPAPEAQRPPPPREPAVAAIPPPTGPVTTIDLKRLAAAGFVTPDVRRSHIADEFRILKRPLLANANPGSATPIRQGNLVMVTSSIPGEGKTFTSVNLAMSIAMELDRTVLLVDGDVARPSLPRTLGIEAGPGLLDVLGPGRRDLGTVLQRTNVPKLSLLLSGTPHARAAEMLASDSMVRFLEELASRYSDRIVIFDSPPLLATTEARVLASRMGQIVFIVHAETTPQGDVKQALATIEACPVKMLVLNGTTTPNQGAYGYGYGYGYGA